MQKRVIVIVEEEIATTINFMDGNNDFYRTLILEPEVVRNDALDFEVNDVYNVDSNTFSRNGELVVKTKSPKQAKFALIKDGIVKFVLEMPYSEELFIAAFSSNPTFEEIKNV